MAEKKNDRKTLLRLGIGAGLLGGIAIAVKYSMRPPRKERLPDSMSPDSFSTKVFPSSHGQIVYHTAGKGDPIVFLHSLCIGASSFEWSKIYPEFTETHRVIAPDLIGFGESERPARIVDAEKQVESIAEMLGALNPKSPAIIVASGLGAGLAVVLASQHPDLASRLILLMPAGLREQGRRRLARPARLVSRLRPMRHFIYRNYLARRPSIRRWFERYAFADPAKVTDEIVDAFASCAQQFHAELAIFNMMAGHYDLELEKRLVSLQQPVRLLWSDKAAYPPLKWSTRYQSLIPACNLTILHDTGIMAALEAPDTVKEIILDELRSGIRLFKTG